MGSAHTEAELGVLLARARELLEEPGQGVLDLGLEPAPPVEPLLGPVKDPTLLKAVDPQTRRRGSGGRVVATDSRVLFEALDAVYAGLEFDTVADPVFRDLVIARIVEPTSLLDVGRVLGDLGQRPASYATLKRVLARVKNEDYRDTIATQCFTHASTQGDVSLVLYDATTLYFEAENEDDLRKVGYLDIALGGGRCSVGGWAVVPLRGEPGCRLGRAVGEGVRRPRPRGPGVLVEVADEVPPGA